MNEGQIKIDNKQRRVNLIIPTQSINQNYKSQADSDYDKKKQEEKKKIFDQLNRADS
jgi:flagellar motor switch protein FliM